MMYPVKSKTPASHRHFAVLGLALWPCLSVAADFPIGVNFTETASHQLTPTESAGAPGFVQTNWNNRGRWGNPIALNDGTGTATPVTVKWDATGIWATNADETQGGNHKLMKGYLDSDSNAITTTFNGVFGGDDDKPTILITGLDAWMTANNLTSYSVVIYSDGDSNSGQRAAKVWLAAADTGTTVNGDPGLGNDLTSRIDIVDNSNWGDNPNFTKVTGTGSNGNYAVFSAVTAGAFYLRLDEAGSNPFRCPINGFQIIGTNVAAVVDTDGDGMSDAWESNHGLDPQDNGSVNAVNGAAGDPDADDRTNLQEYNSGTNSTNPQNPDTDNDGLDDGDEVTAGTTPLDPDSDDDTLPDGWEVKHSINPLENGTLDPNNGPNGDPDGEGLSHFQEFQRGTDPHVADTDGDGYDDLCEDKSGAWTSEFFTGSDPIKPDTDGDGIEDGDENPDSDYAAGTTSGTDPNFSDTDGDGTNDRWEFLLGTDPTLDTSNVPTVTVTNPSFEFPDVAGTYRNGAADGWTFVNGVNADDTFVENITSIGMTGGAGLQLDGIQEPGAYLHQDTGVPFSPNTTYLIDLAGGYRNGYGAGVVEFGLFSSNSVGTLVPGYTGKMDLNGTLTASGNPDADNVVNKLRDASILSIIGSGSLGRPYSLVTGATAPTGNLVPFIRHVSGGRVLFDNLRILAVPNSLDADNDGLPDGWELANNLSPADNGATIGGNGASGDPDNDGSSNAEELAAGSDPRDGDTDNDGLADGLETGTGEFIDAEHTGTSPLQADSDGDTFDDLVEVSAGTDPNDENDHPITVEPAVTEFGFNGDAFELTVANLAAGKSYTLARSTTLTGFTPIGTPVTGVTTHTFSDADAPEGSAYYRVEEVIEP